MQKNKYSCFELHGLQNIRLNPLDSFPKETDFRFVLFVLAILGADLFIYGNFYHTFFGESSISPSYLISLVLWMLGGCFFNFIIAGISYFHKPEWQIRKENLTQLKDDHFRGITSYLEQLCDQVNLANRPTFLWDTDDLSFDGGQVFGRLHHYYIRLPDGFMGYFKKSEARSKFRAVVLHELAHIRNHDVDKIQLTNTIFLSFLITSIPILIISLLQSPFQQIWDMGWRFAILILLVYLIRRSILRVREFYADLRASIWQGKSDVLQEIFSEEKSSRKTCSNWLKQLKLKGTWELWRYDQSLIKRVRLIRRADGYYVQFCVSVKLKETIEPSHTNVGLDVGLKEFYTDSKGNTEPNPRFYRQGEKRLKFYQKRVSRKVKGSSNYRAAINKLGRTHLNISRQRVGEACA